MLVKDIIIKYLKAVLLTIPLKYLQPLIKIINWQYIKGKGK